MKKIVNCVLVIGLIFDSVNFVMGDDCIPLGDSCKVGDKCCDYGPTVGTVWCSGPIDKPWKCCLSVGGCCRDQKECCEGLDCDFDTACGGGPGICAWHIE